MNITHEERITNLERKLRQYQKEKHNPKSWVETIPLTVLGLLCFGIGYHSAQIIIYIVESIVK